MLNVFIYQYKMYKMYKYVYLIYVFYKFNNKQSIKLKIF